MSTDHAAPCLVCGASADYTRYTCQRCPDRMRRQLGEVEDYHAALDAEPGSGGKSERRAPGFGSRSPARDDVIAANDRRSLPHVLGPDDEERGIKPVLETLHMLALWIAEEAGDDRGRHEPTVTTEGGYLRSRIDWCTGQPWVDELAEEIAELHGQLSRLAGDPPEKPLAYCSCGGPLWSQGNQVLVSVRCGACGTTYSGADILRIVSQGEVCTPTRESADSTTTTQSVPASSR
ncbi:hypothetical protein [Actinopolyspora halophila]|uniref:hypothetical protein n=1 Tax=Actinopolyspora halophila TaxID=1850 RepID=UPI0003655A31|nr:hypothetical protein [Actinopolyspora halophila]